MTAPLTKSPVTSLTYYLTEACNLRCTYCYQEKNPKRSSAEVGKAAIDFLVRESGARKSIHLRFFGGEPLLELDLIKELAAYGREQSSMAGKRIRYDMISNGTLLTRETVDLLREMGVEVISSVDGSRSTMQANRPFYNIKKSFDGYDEKLSYASASGVAKVARMTVSPHQSDIVDDIKHILRLGYDSITIALATNVDWKEENISSIYDGMAGFYIDTARGGSILPLQPTNQLLLARHEIENGMYEPPSGGFCSAGKDMLGVTVDGELYPCHRFVQLGTEFRIGDVFTGIESDKREPFLGVTTATLHHEICRTCHALPYCPGSCMAANLPASGDMLYPEGRHCLDLRAHVNAVDRIYDSLIDACEPFSSFIDRAWRQKRAGVLRSLISESLGEE
ncbi:MAG TPA: radical SAM protein [Blastocatellia bacterium]|nr:radical SAM protein [Blastocatellia bacterium]